MSYIISPKDVGHRIGWTIFFFLMFLLAGIVLHPLYYIFIRKLNLLQFFDMYSDFQAITMVYIIQWVAYSPRLFKSIANIKNSTHRYRLGISIFVNFLFCIINIPLSLVLLYIVMEIHELIFVPTSENEKIVAVSYFVDVAFITHVTIPFIMPKIFYDKKGVMNPTLCHCISFLLWIFTLPAYMNAHSSGQLLFTIINSFLMVTIFLHDNFILNVACKKYYNGDTMERTNINLAVIFIGAVIYLFFVIYFTALVLKIYNMDANFSVIIEMAKQYACFFQEAQWPSTLIVYYCLGNPLAKKFLAKNNKLPEDQRKRYTHLMWAPSFMTFIFSIIVALFATEIMQPIFYNKGVKLQENAPKGIFIYSYSLFTGVPMLAFFNNHLTSFSIYEEERLENDKIGIEKSAVNEITLATEKENIIKVENNENNKNQDLKITEF